MTEPIRCSAHFRSSPRAARGFSCLTAAMGPASTARLTAGIAAFAMAAACATQGDPRSPVSPGAALASAAPSAEAAALANYTLTLERIEGLRRAQRGLARISRMEPAPVERLQDSLQEVAHDDVEGMARATRAEPAVRDVLAAAGISPRDYYMTQYNLVHSVALLDARAARRGGDFVPVSERNLEFVRRNRAAVDRVMTERQRREP